MYKHGKILKVQYRVCGTEPTKRFARHVYTGEGNMGLFCGFLSTLRAGNDSSFCHGWRSLLPFPASASALASLCLDDKVSNQCEWREKRFQGTGHETQKKKNSFSTDA